MALVAAGAYWLSASPTPRSSTTPAAPAGARRPELGTQQPDRRGARPPATQSPTRREQPAPGPPVDGAGDDDDEADDGAPPLPDAPAALELSELSEPAHPALPPAAAAAPAAETAEPPDEQASERPARAQPRPRRLELSVLRRWTQPGLCARAEQATEAQRALMAHFRAAELGAGARVFLDPRLPAGAEQPALEHLEEAARILRAELQLSPGVPDVFLYQDVHLLLASACTNADVVAYYDGALHIVVTRDDVRESVLHEFTHHALMTAGVLGPAWLQEGMAMHIAQESWWRRPDLLKQLIDRPFSLSTMETMVPYTLESEQAVLFYVQSAAMVECATQEPDSSLSELLSELNVRQSAEALEYGLPALAELSALRECMRELQQEPEPRQRQ